LLAKFIMWLAKLTLVLAECLYNWKWKCNNQGD
jgi:hypothetical protein